MMFRNQTRVIELILLGFGDSYQLQIPLLFAFLVIYFVTISGNTLIVLLIVSDQHLHSPMYFFLGNLSFLEACYSSCILPRLLSALRTGDRSICIGSCFTQWYLSASLVATECCLLCVMSYDRYLAICKPLHYATIMNTQMSILLAAASWISGFAIFLIVLTLMLQRLNICGLNEVDHYFCEYFALLKLSCNDTSLLEMTSFIVAAVFTLPPFLLTLTSYVYIIAAILRITSITGRQRAFSTCSSHLVVVSIFYGSLMIAYMLPRTEGKSNMSKFYSLLYIALPPLANPFIYSLRNKEVKGALRNNINRLVPSKSYRWHTRRGVPLFLQSFCDSY